DRVCLAERAAPEQQCARSGAARGRIPQRRGPQGGATGRAGGDPQNAGADAVESRESRHPPEHQLPLTALQDEGRRPRSHPSDPWFQCLGRPAIKHEQFAFTPDPGPTPHSDRLHASGMLELAAAVWRRRKWLAIPVFVVPMTAATSVVAFVPNLYQSTATVLVDRQQV